MIPITINYLIEKYDTLLFDAYGVLVNDKEVLPGAVKCLDFLDKIEKKFFIVSNSFSNTKRVTLERFVKKGFLCLSEDHFVTPADMFPKYFVENDIRNKRVAVVGGFDFGKYMQK